MRRAATVLTLAVGGLLVAGCAYDPYTGTYAPCCSYYGYRYPAPYYNPYGYQAAPYAPAPQVQPGGYQYQPTPYTQPPLAQPGGYQYQPAPYAQPSQAQPSQAQPGAYPYQPAPIQPYASPGAAADPERGGWVAERFAMANTAQDGRLTRDQAVAGMPFVAENFDAIDVDHKGFVTLPEVRAFAEYRRTERGQPVGPGVQ